MTKSIAFALVAAAGIASAASAQITANYEIRIVADGEAGAPNIAGVPNLPYSPTASTVGMWVQARVTLSGELTTGTTATQIRNFGIGRFTAANQTEAGSAIIRVSDSVSSTTIGRGQIGESTDGNTGDPITLFGVAPGYRSMSNVDDSTASDWHSSDLNGPGVLVPHLYSPDTQHGALGGDDTIYGFDAYVGSFRSAVIPATQRALPNVASAWASLYHIVVNVGSGGERTVTVSAQGQLSTLVRTVVVSPNVVNGLGFNQFTTGSRDFIFTPTPGAAALMGLGGLAMARRRRA